MFTVGKEYEFRMLEGTDEVLFWGHVETYDHPLLKLADIEARTIQFIGIGVDGSEDHDAGNDVHVPPHPGRIINVTSKAFISAIEKVR